MTAAFGKNPNIDLQDGVMKRSLIGLSLLLLCLMVSVPRARAHKVTIFAWAEGDKIYTESKFSGGKMVKHGRVDVFDGQGNRLLEGQTDDQGEFSFKIPKITDLNIVLTAGMGHRNSWKLTAAELGAPSPAETAVKPASPEAPATSDTPQQAEPQKGAGLSAGDVEAIVARQLDQKLQPLTRILVAERDKGPTLSDIFGGIGYIIGLVGLGAYVRYRKDGRRP
jgi:nickel transport protein